MFLATFPKIRSSSFLDIQNASELSEKDIQEELKKLKSDGHIFEPKNDKYVVLE